MLGAVDDFDGLDMDKGATRKLLYRLTSSTALADRLTHLVRYWQWCWMSAKEPPTIQSFSGRRSRLTWLSMSKAGSRLKPNWAGWRSARRARPSSSRAMAVS